MDKVGKVIGWARWRRWQVGQVGEKGWELMVDRIEWEFRGMQRDRERTYDEKEGRERNRKGNEKERKVSP